MDCPTRSQPNRHFSTSALNFRAMAEAIGQSIFRHMIWRMKPTSSDDRIEIIDVGETKDWGWIRYHG